MAIDIENFNPKQIDNNLLVNFSIIGGSVLLVSILFFLFVIPKFPELNELKKGVDVYCRDTEEETKIFQNEKQTLEQEKNIELKKMNSAKSKLLVKKDISIILDNVIEIAKQRNIKILSVEPLTRQEINIGADKTRLSIKELSVSLEVESQFSDFLGFLWETEHNGRTFRIKELSISKNKSEGPSYSEKIILSVYELLKED